MSLSLYALSDEARALDDLTAMEDGEFTAEVEALHNHLMDQLVSKADAFGAYVRELEAREEAIDGEMKRLQSRRARLQNRLRWMKAYAMTAMQRMDRTKLEGALFTLAVQKNPPSVLVTVLPDALPPAFVRVIPEQREADKKALLDALKQGATIPGAELAPPTYHLRVR